ncbi:MAG: class I SAM-dependent methyltransferase [Chitinophagaceae bacterium]|nr:class I SAM-dependent methyltransferase [Chitinophagaceae bacterium]
MSNTQDIQQQKTFYDAYWKDMAPLSSYKLQRMAWITECLVSIRKNIDNKTPTLLDLGCGDGRLAPLWQSIIGGDTYGLELSPKAVEVANKMFPSVKYTEGDATNTPYDSNTFDVIVCQEVLEHVEEQQKLVDECNRILKKGGYLILTTPNKFYFDRRDGGNYSNQPIENIIDKTQLLELIQPAFAILSYTTLIYAKGDKGIYKTITGRYLLAMLRRMGFIDRWKKRLLKKGYGLHMAVVCQKS